MRSKRQQASPPSTRMNLRSYRNNAVLPMETSSSSSDDSCDSFGSDGFGTSKRPLRQTRSSARVQKAFSALPVTEEEDACSGFENDLNDDMTEMKMDSDSEACSPPRKMRKSFTLRVAMKFPNRQASLTKPESPESKPKDPEPDSEENNFMLKRALNIKENKAMLAKLMAELEKVPGPIPRRSALSQGNTVRSLAAGSLSSPEDEYPEQTSRPLTRSRSLVDRPPSPPPEDESEDKYSLVRGNGLDDEDDDEEERGPRRRSYNGYLTIPHVVRPVEEITKAELDNVCVNVREKIYNRATGSTCHQCRQKTIDSKTNCRNQDCVGVRGQFCGPCLKNRYGEDVREALLNPDWLCPPCRGICNCSFCRARKGRCATGVLVYLAKYHGHDNVHSYLKSLKKELEESE
ncbi:cell division cycle-associated protein 7a [Puntigrus tetrazona]|uniref:cell division cycle-associated protein 7a n=1 Tax=Puntigrus tetrazona TaxID=1606681 RepID=UPI001C89A099|nr:cell division cycle-associated protein 7a [Puntigrus tetrazona]